MNIGEAIGRLLASILASAVVLCISAYLFGLFEHIVLPVYQLTFIQSISALIAASTFVAGIRFLHWTLGVSLSEAE